MTPSEKNLCVRQLQVACVSAVKFTFFSSIGKGQKRRKPLSEVAHQEQFGQSFS
jgi:hypothetical protein